jgi:hypothetical protein
MSKKKKEDGVQIYDGEIVRFDGDRNFSFVVCCECKLTHLYSFFEICKDKKGEECLKPLSIPIAVQIFRDNDATKWNRRWEKKKK